MLRLLPNSQELYGLYDIKEWMSTHLSNVKGHTQPHHFRFLHDPNSPNPTNVTVQFKGTAQDPWVNLGRSFWKPSGSRHFNARSAAPKVVQPDLEGLNMETLRTKFDRWACVFSDQKEKSQLKWWKEYADFIIRTQNSERSRKRYANRNADWVVPKLPKCDVSSLSGTDDTPVIGDALQKLLDDEVRQPTVSIR